LQSLQVFFWQVAVTLVELWVCNLVFENYQAQCWNTFCIYDLLLTFAETTFMKILIGYDGSEYGEVILEDLKQAGLPKDTEASVLTVADVREIPPPLFLAQRISTQIENIFNAASDDISTKLQKYNDKALSDARDFTHKILEAFPHWKVTTESEVGNPTRELIKRSDKLKPDVLVVGSHGRTVVGRLLLGSVSHKILHEAHSSVRISRKRNNDHSGNRILLAVDGSANAEDVLKTVAERSWRKDTELRLVAVDDPFNRAEVGYLNWNHKEDKPLDNEKSKQWIETVINKPKQMLVSRGLQVSHKILWGDAATMLLEEAETWNADTIFIGARGLGRVKRFLLGSVSSKVASSALCSVEVIRHKNSGQQG
jgi:nucleotide-binding universal stress UspA family protein